jgi:hypothetical protein
MQSHFVLLWQIWYIFPVWFVVHTKKNVATCLVIKCTVLQRLSYRTEHHSVTLADGVESANVHPLHKYVYMYKFYLYGCYVTTRLPASKEFVNK